MDKSDAIKLMYWVGRFPDLPNFDKNWETMLEPDGIRLLHNVNGKVHITVKLEEFEYFVELSKEEQGVEDNAEKFVPSDKPLPEEEL